MERKEASRGVEKKVGFFEKLEALCYEKESLLCVGLDPRIPPGGVARDLVTQNQRLIEATRPYAVCYKPNMAFYEALGPAGLVALQETLAHIPEEIPVLIDAKRGDIASTAEAYAHALFTHYRAEAVTLSPYLGYDAVLPFLQYEGKAFFLLCRTTNPGANRIQEWNVMAKESAPTPLYLQIAMECSSWERKRVGLVVSGKDLEALRNVRLQLPETWFLSPGIGVQGGHMREAVEAGLRKDGLGLLLNVSRSLAEAHDPAEMARAYTKSIQEARGSLSRRWQGESTGSTHKKTILSALITSDSFRVGQFRLKSGKISPFYIDIRRAASLPHVLRILAKGYAELLAPLTYDRIAGIPVAALPLATAVSLVTGKPMIYPRMPRKAHGMGNAIEGSYEKGERIVLLDDLVTTGGSKLEAISILREEGLLVNDLVVLLERGEQGRREMQEAQVKLWSYITLDALLEQCLAMGHIDREGFDAMIAYIKKGSS